MTKLDSYVCFKQERSNNLDLCDETDSKAKISVMQKIISQQFI